jgi:hypothetical protein
MSSSNALSATGAHHTAQIHLDSARIFARGGEHQAALDSLERAIDAGWTNTSWWSKDPDLKAVENDPRFQMLIKESLRMRARA